MLKRDNSLPKIYWPVSFILYINKLMERINFDDLTAMLTTKNFMPVISLISQQRYQLSLTVYSWTEALSKICQLTYF